MFRHCHLGNFNLLRTDYFEDSSLCKECYSHVHFVMECMALANLQSRWLESFVWGQRGL